MYHEDVFGQVLEATYAKGQADSEFSGISYAIERDDAFLAISNSFIYFLEHSSFPEKEKELLNLVRGKTVDLACGAGRMSLHLSEKEIEVLSTDLSEGALRVCRNRGLDTLQLDFTNPEELLQLHHIDTIIVFGNSIPLVGSPEGLVEFLNTTWEITTAKGQILGDFNSPIPTSDQTHLAYHQRNRNRGHPIGTVTMRVRYRDFVGSWFDFWLPTKEEFIECVEKTQWKLELIDDPGYYFILKKDNN